MARREKEPAYYTSKTNTQVRNYNVYVMNAQERRLYGILTAVCGGAVGLIFYGGLFKSEGTATMATLISNVVVFVVGAILSMKVMMPIITESLRKKTLEKLRSQFCDFAFAFSNALGTGMNVNGAIQASYEDLTTQYSRDELIVVEVREILNGMGNNVTVEELFADFGKRSGIRDIMDFAVVFATCFRTGGNIRQVIGRTANVISEKMMIASEIETTITSNKMQMSIMNVLPIFIILMMRIMSSEFAESFASVIGVFALTVAAGLFIGAYIWGKKIMDIKG